MLLSFFLSLEAFWAMLFYVLSTWSEVRSDSKEVSVHAHMLLRQQST